MNLAESLVAYLQSLDLGTFGQDIFIGDAPSSNKVPDAIWWVISSGGTPVNRYATGEMRKTYTLDIYKRDTDYKTVYDELSELEQTINCDGCLELSGFDTIDVEVSGLFVDDDLDSEDRKVGLLQCTITTFNDCRED